MIGKDIWVHLLDNRGDHKIAKVQENKKFSWRKHKITIGQLIGKEFNTYYKIDGNGNMEQVSASVMWDTEQELVAQNELDQGKNNKELFDHNISQKLTQEEILELKQQEDGEDIVKQLIANSETFNQKTEYSQAKYVKKKKEKYLFCCQVSQCTLESVHTTWYQESAAKINFMRIDSFAILLQLAGIQQQSQVLLFENVFGLVLAGIAERLDGDGQISLVLANQNKQFIKDLLPFAQMNFGQQILDSIKLKLNYEDINSAKYTHIIFAGEFQLVEIFEKVHQQLLPGGVVLVFSSFLEKLSELSEVMMFKHSYTQIKIFDSFLRYHQVLENRTHPKVDMDAFGGYMLHAYKLG